MKNQMRVDATLRFDLEGYLVGNEDKTNFSLDIHFKQKYALKQTRHS